MLNNSNSMKFLLEKTHEEAYSEPKHQHQCYLLVYCKSGKGFFVINGINIPFKANTYAVSPPSYTISEIGVNTVCYHLGFNYNNHLEELSFGLFNDNNKELLHIIENIQLELLNHDSFSDYSLEANLQILICMLKRTWHKSSLFQATHIPSELTDIVSYFNQNYEQQINIGSLFESMGYSYHYLRHVFKTTYGVSPAHYLTQIRLDAAKKLLLTTNLSIPEISQKIGFKTVSTFYSAFLKNTEKTPEDFRKDKR